MLKRVKKWNFTVLLIVLVLMGTAIFLGCSSDETENGTVNGDLSSPSLNGRVTVIGSTSVGPLARVLADSFMENEQDVKIDIQEIGSTQGIQAINDGTADIGTVSRELKEDEKSSDLTEHVIAYDGIAVVVNCSNSVSDLTIEKIAQIFKGEITNWKELGGFDKEITVVNREAGSGTRGAFQELMKLEEKLPDGTKKSLITEKALIMDSTGGVKATVSGNDSAIGYISLGILDDTVKALKVSGVEPTVQNILDKKYTICRPFLMITKGEMSPQVGAYLDFIMSSEGQQMVKSEKYIPVK
ncbi:MAG: phosphate ABC transporter substrate-binding protein [Clostridia bacterium]|nr:phosphate ABC transporter substrate-binding protein [Clostridia bacterium]MDD4048168.1 phosphate ABC transporter substrate-binding protein [Clostridia bacterium]